MLEKPAGPRVEDLLRHTGWVRALAHRLVSGESEADDLVQDRPSAFIEGVVGDGRGNFVGGAMVLAHGILPGMSDCAARTEQGTGRFRLGPMPPGRYALEVIATGFPAQRTEGRDLARGETWNAGTLTLHAGGRLVATLRRTDGGSTSGLSLSLFDSEGRSHEVSQDKYKAQSGPLAPGRYTLRAMEDAARPDGTVYFPISFDIRDHEEVRLEYVLRPEVYRSLMLLDERDPASRGQESASVQVWDDSGTLVHEGQITFHRPEGGLPELTLAVAAGTYRVEVRLDGAIFKESFQITELSPQVRPIEIPIR
ncbi:MAG: carboxypeptidase-like regulatory domain-containing protein [Planctomycetota bacterium]